MFLQRIGLTGLLVGLGIAASGCTDGYGYSGVNVGIGSGGYYDPYNDGYGGYGSYAGYGGYGGAYAPSYYGWSGNYYYPGTGVYVYDRDRRRYRWNDGQRRYWEGRRGSIGGNARIRDNWADFRRDARQERRDYRGDIRQHRQAYRNGTITREQYQAGRRDARREVRQDINRGYRETRRENRIERQGNPGAGRAFRGGGGGERSSGRRGGIPRPQDQ